MFHTPPKFRRCALLVASAYVLAGPVGAIAADPAIEDPAALESLARTVGAAQFPPLTARERLQVGPLQPRLQLARCAEAVKPVVSTAPHMKDRVMIELRCQGPTPWHLYVPVRIVGTSAVAIAAHALVAGSVLTAKDVTVEQHDVSALPPGYLDDAALAVGLTVARPIAGGAILTNQQLMGARAVQRGQSVTLLADAGGISIRMAGKALSDGLVNQRIKVQNLSSGKIVEGVARSEQVVEIILR